MNKISGFCKIFFLTLCFLFINYSYSQKIVEMNKVNGVYQIPCKINGIPLNFIFDTGATDVSLSLIEAEFLFKQGLLSENDFLQKSKYQTADGTIVEGMKINLKSIEIDGIVLKNVSATIIESQNAPLLLGQSAIKRLGRYSIENNNLILYDYDTNSNNSLSASNARPRINENALKYYNSFLLNEHFSGKDVASLTFDKYSNEFNYVSERILFNRNDDSQSEKNPFAKFKTEFKFKLEDIVKVTAVVIPAGSKNNTSGSNLLSFSLEFDKAVEVSKYIFKKGELPSEVFEKNIKVGLDVFKKISNDELNSIQSAIQDIFVGKHYEVSSF